MSEIGSTGMITPPWCLGGNVFGWTADRDTSFGVLDAFVAAGGRMVDTADVYSAWADGNEGGESEAIVGEWLRRRRNRDQLLLATKVGMWSRRPGLAAATVASACDDSLRRLGVDHIDLYYAHIDDAEVPIEETLGAFDALVRVGKVGAVAASNITAARLAESLRVSAGEGLTRYVAVQNQYSLVHRADVEGDLQDLCVAEGVGIFPYYALAEGYLTGKYLRPGTASQRQDDALAYADAPGRSALSALLEVATGRGVAPGAVALAWLSAQPGVVAPIASARTAQQVAQLAPALTLALSPDEVTHLTHAWS